MKKAPPQKYSESFSHIDLQELNADRNVYENCEFLNCSFSTILNIDFTDCGFINCNLSNVKFNFCGLQNVTFTDCKLMGADFFQSKDFMFSVNFDNCNMDYTSFDKKKMYKSTFRNCRVHGANFTQADLSRSTLFNCDLHDSIFLNTDLSGVDFTTCINFLIDPETNTIKKAKFSRNDLTGLLYRHDIIIE